MDSLFLAWRYLRTNWARTIILVICTTVIGGLPLATNRLLNASEQQLLQRASATPLLLGSRGSDLDLVVGSLYFRAQPRQPLRLSDATAVRNSGLATPIPLLLGHRAQGARVVGTSLDYFGFRGLAPARGSLFTLLGECVLGADVAHSKNLHPGDTITTAPRTLFDLAGSYPIRLRVAGVLRPSGSDDDEVIFTDLKTTWVMSGLGHGHQDLTATTPTDLVLEQRGNLITANAKLAEVPEITAESLGQFHFHGDQESFPISSLIAVPQTPRDGDLLRGRFETGPAAERIVAIRPLSSMRELLVSTFRLRRVFNVVLVVIALAALLALLLVYALSLRLRREEFRTCRRMGARQGVLRQMVAAEIAIVLLLAAAFSLALQLGLVGLRPVVSQLLLSRNSEAGSR
ncbi:MAG: ABC transporter permease [Synechococcus sp.]|nr:ABC transporter permease [Synechococcus sp.]